MMNSPENIDVGQKPSAVQAWLMRAPSHWFIFYASMAAFLTYFSMYAFRKPLAVGIFDDVAGWSYLLDFKVILMISQIAGYALSKWIGVKVISEMTSGHRARAILGLVLISEAALILFALLPTPYNVGALFFNGLPLGMIWGLVFSYLEGRRTSEILGVGLCTSFILSSGIVKTVAKYLMLDWGVSEFWMPAVTGVLFLPLLFISVYFLSQIPAPNRDDIMARHRRVPMDKGARWSFFSNYTMGLSVLIIAYVIFTAFRDFRDIFAAELWTELGFGDTPSIFTLSEAPTALLVLLILGSTMVFRNNIQAFKIYHYIIAFGAALLSLSTWAFQAGYISSLLWMMLLSFGLYLAYVPFNCMLFDRLMAVVKRSGNAGFLIYLADAFGYVGSFGLMLFKNLYAPDLPWVDFLADFSYVTAITGVIFLGISLVYFTDKFGRDPAPVQYKQPNIGGV